MSVIKDATKADVFEMARKLPWHERWELIKELSETIPPPPPDGMTKQEFLAELDRRWEQHLADPSKARPIQEVMDEIRQKYQPHG